MASTLFQSITSHRDSLTTRSENSAKHLQGLSSNQSSSQFALCSQSEGLSNVPLQQLSTQHFASQVARINFGDKANANADIPMIDISGLFVDGKVTAKERAQAQKLGEALTKKSGTGFVAVAMDEAELGLTREGLIQFSDEIQTFLDNNVDYLMKFYKEETLQQFGYQPNWAELTDNKEIMHLQPPHHGMNLMYPEMEGDDQFNAFVKKAEAFYPTQEKVMLTLVKLLDLYFKPVFEDKKLPDGFFRKMMGFNQDGDYITDGNNLFRTISYPELSDEAFYNGGQAVNVKGSPIIEELEQGKTVRKYVRAKQHDDMDFITVIPEPAVAGLEVQKTNGKWLSTHEAFQKHKTPGKLRFIVNTGNQFKDATAGLDDEYTILSTTHRVVSTADKSTRKARVSIPLFVHPNHREPLMNIENGQPVEKLIKKGPFEGVVLNLGTKEGIFPYIVHQQAKRMNAYLNPIKEKLDANASVNDKVEVFKDFYTNTINMPNEYFGPTRPKEQSIRSYFNLGQNLPTEYVYAPPEN
jgi:isopenicillin N synthase-like dioxygenase